MLKGCDFAIFPTGYVYVVFRSSLTRGVKWATSPPWSGELAAVEKTVSAAMEAYPGIRGTTYEEWWVYLQAHIERLASERMVV